MLITIQATLLTIRKMSNFPVKIGHICLMNIEGSHTETLTFHLIFDFKISLCEVNTMLKQYRVYAPVAESAPLPSSSKSERYSLILGITL